MIEGLYVADNFFSRLKGLLFRPPLEKTEALLITKCNSVHTFFMKYSIDVLFLDSDFTIVGIEENIKPGRISKTYKKAYYTLEIQSGTNEYSMGENLNFLKEIGGGKYEKI